MKFREWVTVAPRFTRAINLQRDYHTPSALDGYVLTATGSEILGRLNSSVGGGRGSRCWTLTGPYGSGKSAFALFIAKLLGPADAPGATLARGILESTAPELHAQLFDRRRKWTLPTRGFCPVLVSGSGEPLVNAIVRASYRDVREYCRHRGRPLTALKELERLNTLVEKGRDVSSAAVAELMAKVALQLQKNGSSQGVLLLVDELGKFLEFAAREVGRGDLFILQQLAEAAGTAPKPNLLLLTILHQSFDKYAANLGLSARQEWAKIQGRFEDVAFQESPQQVLSLIARAISHKSGPLPSAAIRAGRIEALKAFRLGLAPNGIGEKEFVGLMARCVPLHPLGVLCLARLCGKFGQNQRSLFAFLASREPHGFSDFLGQEMDPKSPRFFQLADLYDYVSEAMGSGLAVGENATRWAEVQSTLDRIAQSTAEEKSVVKVVGLLSAVGAYGNLKPSPDAIELALGLRNSDLKRVLSRLSDRSILVFRRHSQAFALWQGSDVDLDLKVQEAKRRLVDGLGLARKLNSYWRPRPLVAKRHSYLRGTLRYFAVRFADCLDFYKSLMPEQDADGLIVYCLPSTKAEHDQLMELVVSAPAKENASVLVAVPRDVGLLKSAVEELEILRWIETNTPELHGDLVARKELRSRLAIAEARVAAEVKRVFTPEGMASQQTSWFHRGIPLSLRSGRKLSQLLSDICDSVYKDTPVLRNELINRRTLSSAAAAARRNLVEAMLQHSTAEKLGISGTPPEMSIYASLFGSTGIHRLEPSGYRFGVPPKNSSLTAAWKAIEKFFESCELQSRSVNELFGMLQQPPFGLKMGVIPLLFCAAALVHDTEIAFYENDAFVPELTVEAFERLLRTPDKFRMRRYRITGVRKEVFDLFATLLGDGAKKHANSLVAVVRPLFKFLARLPDYSRYTTRLSDVTLRVREALLAAREPDRLLFEELPRACGFPAFDSSEQNPTRATDFFKVLRTSLTELQRAYDDLLADSQDLLLRSLNAGERGRELLRFRSQPLLSYAVEPRLKAFLYHLSEDHLEDVEWLEAVATMVVGKPPRSWNDTDRARYEVVLSDLGRAFKHLESLVFEVARQEQLGQPPAEVLRIGVTDRHTREMEAVVTVEWDHQDQHAEAVVQIEKCLDQLKLAENPNLSLAALATVCRRFLSELEASGERRATKSTHSTSGAAK